MGMLDTVVPGDIKTICYFNLPAWGHIYPTLDLVRSLINQHRRVYYFSTPAFRQCIEDVGATFVDLYSFWIPGMGDEFQHLDKILLKASNYYLETIGYSLKASYHIVSQLSTKKNEWKPDIILHDNCCLWGKLLATLWDTPAICTYSTFILQSGYFRHIPFLWFLDEWKGYKGIFRFIKYRLKFRYQFPKLPILIQDMVLNKETKNIVFLPQELQMQSYLLNHQYDFFPRTNDFRSTEEDLDFNVKEPFLYVSLGTIHKQNRALLQNMIWILSELQIPSVISAGEYYKSFHNPSPNIIQLHSFVPQIHILKHSYCRGFISHGGMNSVVEAWSNKIPLYIIPQTLEQLLTGIQIQEINGGFVIRKKHPSFRSLYNFLRHHLRL
jgi:MGT family glycosyltransferase